MTSAARPQCEAGRFSVLLTHNSWPSRYKSKGKSRCDISLAMHSIYKFVSEMLCVNYVPRYRPGISKNNGARAMTCERRSQYNFRPAFEFMYFCAVRQAWPTRVFCARHTHSTPGRFPLLSFIRLWKLDFVFLFYVCGRAHGTHKSHNRLWAPAIWENKILCEQKWVKIIVVGVFWDQRNIMPFDLAEPQSFLQEWKTNLVRKKHNFVSVSASHIAVLYFLLQTWASLISIFSWKGTGSVF